MKDERPALQVEPRQAVQSRTDGMDRGTSTAPGWRWLLTGAALFSPCLVRVILLFRDYFSFLGLKSILVFLFDNLVPKM